MLNITSLYNAVFKPALPKYDPKTDYFTVLIETPSFKFGQEIRSKIEYLMTPDSYMCLNIDGDSDVMKNKLTEVDQKLDKWMLLGNVPARRYCFLAYFDEENQDYTSLLKLVSDLPLDQNDVVTLMLCVSKEIGDTNEAYEHFVDTVAQAVYKLSPKIDLFLFTDKHIRSNYIKLVNSISGSIIMNSKLASYEAKRVRRDEVERYVKHHIDQLPEAGQQAMQSMLPIRWSSVHLNYYDRQDEFLNKYIITACQNLKKLSADNFYEMLNSIYESLIPEQDELRVSKALKEAVDRIPYISSTPPKNIDLYFRNYFEYLYGDKAVSTIELSLKATLSGIFNYRTEDKVVQVCDLIFDKCSGFAVDDLYDQVCSLLEAYLNTLDDSRNELAKDLKRYLDNTPYTSGLDVYLGKYTQLYTMQKVRAFWNDVLKRIRTYKSEYDSYNDKACEYHDQIKKLCEGILVQGFFDFSYTDTKQFTAEEILTLESDEDAIEHIRSVFASCQIQDKDIDCPTDCESVFTASLDPFFSRCTQGIEWPIASNSFVGCELNGLYLSFM